MPVSKKQQACVNRYISGHYDRISLTLPKGSKEHILKAGNGAPVNTFIREAINEKLIRNGKAPLD